MKWSHGFLARLAFTLLLIVLVTEHVGAASKGPLSRDAALAILKKSARCARPGGVFDLELKCSVPDRGRDPAQRLEKAQSQLKFLRLMVSAGVLSEGPTSVIQVNDVGPLGWTGDYPVTKHSFHGVPQPYLKISPETAFANERVYTTTQEFHCTGVKGIRQGASEAQVEVAFSASLTPLGVKLRDAMQKVWCDDCGSPKPDAAPDWDRLFSLVFKLPAPNMEIYQFALWDDGWRLAQ